jgi:dTDP-glucose 4,6-dehydratase
VNPLAEDLNHVLSHTENLWKAIRRENIFVTGGTGFFGRWLLESFAHANRELQLDARLIVLSRRPEAFLGKAQHLQENAAIEFVTGNVRAFSASDCDAALPEGRRGFGFVVHAATESGTNLGAENPLLMWDTIVEGTRRTLDFAVAHRARRFLLTSSGAVYGRQPPEITHIPEDYRGAPDCADPGAAYGEGKRAAELLCHLYRARFDLHTIIARCFALVGPHLPLDGHFAIGNFIRDALTGRPIAVNGDGTPYRSYLHAADLMIWLWTMLLKAPAGEPYNVGSEDRRTIREVAELVARLGGAPGVEVMRQPNPAAAAAQYVPSCARARADLALRQWIDLPDAIGRTLKVLRQIK